MRQLIRETRAILPTSARRRLPLLFTFVIATGVLETVAVAMIPFFVILLRSGGDLREFGHLPLVGDIFAVERGEYFLLYTSAAIGAFFLIKNTLLVAIYTYQARFVARQEAEAAQDLLAVYLGKPYTFHLQRNSAELLRNILTETRRLFRGVFWQCLVLLSEACVSVLILALLLVVDPLTSLVAVVMIGGVGAAYYYFIRSRSFRWGRSLQFHSGQVIQWINQSLGAVKEMKLRRKEDYFLTAFGLDMGSYAAATAKNQIATQIPRYLIETVAVLVLVAVVMFMGATGGDVQTILPRLALFAAAAFRIMPSVNRIVNAATSVRHNQTALDVLAEEMSSSEEPALQEAHTAEPSGERPFELEKAIEMHDVTYQYPGAEETALSGVSLRIPRGTSAAFVGSSGAGKTTVVDLILGLLTPTSGRVEVDDVDIQDQLEAWQAVIGYIPQHVYLYDDSVRRNVAFGVPDAEISDEQVWKVLDDARIGDLVRMLERGLDQPLGELGNRLSGGQRQRIGIARALYHEPTVLVLDEATAALDTETEREITSTLEQFRGTRTLIFIAHRLSTVRNCDTLFVMSEGRVVASGTYDELLVSSKDFQRIAG